MFKGWRNWFGRLSGKKEVADIAPVGIEAMVARLTPGGKCHISFEPGKYGRMNRFVFVEAEPHHREELLEIQADPDGETQEILGALDALVKTSADFGILYNNPRNRRFAYCIWRKMVDKRAPFAGPMILPIYEQRLAEQKRILDGTLKKGHKAFGFYPLEGHS